MIFRALNRDEKGSAMTEFVVGLPIFILIFSGMGSLYSVSQAGLSAMAGANTQLWIEAQDSIKTSVAITPAAAVFSIGSFSDLLTTGTQAGGIYVDSWAKVKLASIIPGAPGPVSPARTVEQIHAKFRDKSPAKHLLDDFYRPRRSTGGFSGFLSSLISTTGSGLGIAAGIRYGAVEGSKTISTNTIFGNYTVGGGRLTLPLNTAATHRLAAVALIRLEHSKDIQTDETILNFNWDANLDGPPDWGATGVVNPPPDGSCASQIQNHGACKQNVSQQMAADWEACGRCRLKRFDLDDVEDACSSQKPDPACKDSRSDGLTPSANACAAFNLPPDCDIKIGG